MLRVVQVVHQQRCNGHCLSDCPAQQLKEQLHSAQVAGQWRGDTALTLPLFWRRSTVSPVFFGRFPRSSQSPCPLPTLSPSLIGHPASVDVKQHESQKTSIVKQQIMRGWFIGDIVSFSVISPLCHLMPELRACYKTQATSY